MKMAEHEKTTGNMNKSKKTIVCVGMMIMTFVLFIGCSMLELEKERHEAKHGEPIIPTASEGTGGVVQMVYKVPNEGRKPVGHKVDWETTQEKANESCKNRGFGKAKKMEAKKRNCVDTNLYGVCTKYEFTISYRCEGSKKDTEETATWPDSPKASKAPIVTETDKVEKITWHYREGSRDWMKGWGSPNLRLYVYMGEKDSEKWLRLRCGIKAADWVHTDKIIFAADEARYEVPVKFWEKKEEIIGANAVKEWVDIEVSKTCENSMCITLSFLEKIAKAEESIVRFSGKYKKDITLSHDKKRDIEAMLEYYNLKEKG